LSVPVLKKQNIVLGFFFWVLCFCFLGGGVFWGGVVFGGFVIDVVTSRGTRRTAYRGRGDERWYSMYAVSGGFPTQPPLGRRKV